MHVIAAKAVAFLEAMRPEFRDYQGKVVVLEWTNPQCPYVVRHYKADTMTNLAAKYGELSESLRKLR